MFFNKIKQNDYNSTVYVLRKFIQSILLAFQEEN